MSYVSSPNGVNSQPKFDSKAYLHAHITNQQRLRDQKPPESPQEPRTAQEATEPVPEAPKQKPRPKQPGDGKRPAPDPDWANDNYDPGSYSIIENYILDFPGLSASATAIALFIVRHMYDGKHDAWPGLDRIQKRFGIGSRCTVQNYIDEAVLAGIFEVTRRGKRLTNVYTLKHRAKV